ncbi:RimK family alpha-L-glutamate ligase [Saccharicrinis sp. FJH54]|uniref:ATP-grasp domain-containing protein n=1 Tax=Saccharicrinis sp. FJH54 TaxID=3344665 RepID=UPI0035D42156
MLIAIHKQKGSFSDGWIAYCEEKNIPYKLVNCYDTDIIKKLEDCDGLMWHWNQNDYRAPLFARQLTISLQKKGIKVFPDINTVWHFDDKLGQKYLMESIQAPYVPTHIYYTKQDALNWSAQTSYPKVFKLRGGASGVNVIKVNTRGAAKKLIQKSFRRGYKHINRYVRFKDRFWLLKRDKNLHALRGVLSGFIRLFIPTSVERMSGKELGYVMFQDFIPGNTYDTRLIVVGDRCFGTRRYCRPGDFRASGSGLYDNSPEIFDMNCVKLAFEISEKIGSQSIAFDFIYDGIKPVICEISYIYCRDIIANCDGYWNKELQWITAEVNAEKFIAEDFINSLKS